MEKRKKEFVLVAVAAAVFVAFAGIQKKQVKQYAQVMGRNIKNTAATATGSVTCTEEKPVVYLTFDDGPSSLTEQYLDILKKHNIHATFFLIGQQVKRCRKALKGICKRGMKWGYIPIPTNPVRFTDPVRHIIKMSIK